MHAHQALRLNGQKLLVAFTIEFPEMLNSSSEICDHHFCCAAALMDRHLFATFTRSHCSAHIFYRRLRHDRRALSRARLTAPQSKSGVTFSSVKQTVNAVHEKQQIVPLGPHGGRCFRIRHTVNPVFQLDFSLKIGRPIPQWPPVRDVSITQPRYASRSSPKRSKRRFR